MNPYANSGVNVEAGYKSNELIREHVEKTYSSHVLGSLGGFGAAFAMSKLDYKEPILISGTDGVGTKLKVAFIMNKHDTIGQDCVAMCVNDILCSGAQPLFFLDYIAVGKNYPEKIEQIVKGISDGCVKAGCSLIGGETAEMPDFYASDEYDLAGFAVGIVEKSDMLNKDNVQKGDTLVAVKSSGLHSNGFSLVRKIIGFADTNSTRRHLAQKIEKLGHTLGDELLIPTKIYVKDILPLIKPAEISGIAHITGGGFGENVPRMLPDGLKPDIDYKKIQILPVFDLIARLGGLTLDSLWNIFNMGVGLVIACRKPEVILNALGDESYIIGKVTA